MSSILKWADRYVALYFLGTVAGVGLFLLLTACDPWSKPLVERPERKQPPIPLHELGPEPDDKPKEIAWPGWRRR